MKALKFSRKNLGIPYAVFMLAFVIFPLLLIILYAFTVENREIVTNDVTAFTFSFSTSPRSSLRRRISARYI